MNYFHRLVRAQTFLTIPSIKIPALVFTILGSLLACSSVPVKKSKEDQTLTMSFEQFDQSQGQGWRGLGESGYHLRAADLINKYIKINAHNLKDWQLRMLNWHAGQLYAFIGDITEVRKRFIESTNPIEPKDSPILWNDYVRATVAFLDRDIGTLKLHRENIANGPSMENGKKANLDVVDGLIKCLDKPYSQAYSCR